MRVWDTSWHTQHKAQSGGGDTRRSSREGSGSSRRGWRPLPSPPPPKGELCFSSPHLLEARDLSPFKGWLPSVLDLPLPASPPLPPPLGAREGGRSSPKSPSSAYSSLSISSNPSKNACPKLGDSNPTKPILITQYVLIY